MKIIVTGAIGHIGSYIIRDLGAFFPASNIVMIDNMMTQRFPSLFNLPLNVNYSFIEGDVNQMNLRQIFFGANVVIHLAAITYVAHSNVEEIYNTNIVGTKNILEAFKNLDVNDKHFIFASTANVYKPTDTVINESSAIKPVNDYAISTKPRIKR